MGRPGTRICSAIAVFSAVALSSCAPSVPTPLASDAACTSFWEAAPATLGSAKRQGTSTSPGIWTAPEVQVFCGLTPVQRTSLPCTDFSGIDWIIEMDADPRTATTFGRTPAARIVLPNDASLEDLNAILVDAGAAAQALPSSKRCS